MFAAQTARLRLQHARLPLATYQQRQFGIFDYFKGKKTEEVKAEEEVATPIEETPQLKPKKVRPDDIKPKVAELK